MLLPRFMAIAVVALVTLMLAWWQVSGWASRPAALAASQALRVCCASSWLDSISEGPHRLIAETRLRVMLTPEQLAEAQRSGQAAGPDMTDYLRVEVNPTKFGYSLPIFFALLLASHSRWRGQGRWRRLLLCIGMILAAQVFIVVMQVLKEVAIPEGMVVEQWVSGWRIELIAYLYQLSVLLLPSLVPIALWMWMERPLLRALVTAAPRASDKVSTR